MRRWLVGVIVFVLPALAQGPSVAAGGVVNGASFAEGQAVAPGSLVSIFGTGLASALSEADTIPLSSLLGGVTVTFNGIAAPLLFVSPGQINAQLPWEIPVGTVTVIVNNNGVASPASAFQAASISPGIFAVQFGVGQAIAINNSDATLAAPVGSIPGLTTHPASAGDAVILYVDGLGPVNPPVADGGIAGTTLTNTNSNPVVLVGGVSAPVLFSGMTPQFVGVNQINILVPQGAPTGPSVPLQIQFGGITTTDQVTMAIQ
jgi:uncharacterized protein (TIGR03437 family)